MVMSPPWDPAVPSPDLGRELVSRLLAPQEWIHRRVETIRFLDEDTLHRHVSVDFDLDPRGEDKGPTYVPVARLVKRPLMSFDLRDEAGAALPTLTTAENGFLAWSALAYAAQVVLDCAVPRSILVSLRSIVFSQSTQGARAADFLLSNFPRDLTARAELVRSPGMVALSRNLAAGFLLITPLYSDHRSRRVLKYAYAQRLSPFGRASVRQSMGVDPLPIEFEVPLIGEARGYHVECHVPEDLQIAEIVVSSRSVDEADQVDVIVDGQGERAHVFVSDQTAMADGYATIRILPSATGMLRATALCASAIFVSLVAGALFGRGITEGSDAAAALMLLVPGLLSAVVSKPGEHRLSSLALRGLRWCVAAASACSFVAAGLIALSVHDDGLRVWFAVLAGVVLLASVIPIWSAFGAAHRASAGDVTGRG